MGAGRFGIGQANRGHKTGAGRSGVGQSNRGHKTNVSRSRQGRKIIALVLQNSILEQAALRQARCFFIGREDGQGEFCRKKFVPLDIS
jgi:hypothetical protein